MTKHCFYVFFAISLALFFSLSSCKPRTAESQIKRSTENPVISFLKMCTGLSADRKCNDAICEEFTGLYAQGHEAMAKRLASISNDDLRDLFYCDFKKVGSNIEPSQYIELMNSAPYKFDWSAFNQSGILKITAEFWDVKWAYGFDSREVYSKVMNLFPKVIQQEVGVNMIDPLVFIKKEFPYRTGERLDGWSSFGFTEDRYSLHPTKNMMIPTLINNQYIDDMPALVMGYFQYPWYLKKLGSGFIDYFRFISKDIIVAQGNYGLYPAGSPDNVGFSISPDALQFWMERKIEVKELAVREHLEWISVPMLKKMWELAPATANLDGVWKGDLVMNQFIAKDDAKLEISSTDVSGSVFSSKSTSSNNLKGQASARNDSGVVNISFNDGPSLQLKQVQEGINALVGKRCLKIDPSQDIPKNLGRYSSFLPRPSQNPFIAQYFEEDGTDRNYCIYYLFRRDV